MKRVSTFLLLGAVGLGLAACAGPYDYTAPYPSYGYVAPYPDEFYSPVYGGFAWGGGWGFGRDRDHDRDHDHDHDRDHGHHFAGGEQHGAVAHGQVANAPGGAGHQGFVGRIAGQAQRPH